MVRKLSLLISLGFLCLVAGVFSSRSAATDPCEDAEVDTGIYCPVQLGDDPNHACNDPVHNVNNGLACPGAKAVKDINPNTATPKYSPGNYRQLQFNSIFQPRTVGCYIRVYCEWDNDKKICKDGMTENIYQNVFFTEKCK